MSGQQFNNFSVTLRSKRVLTTVVIKLLAVKRNDFVFVGKLQLRVSIDSLDSLPLVRGGNHVGYMQARIKTFKTEDSNLDDTK